MKTSLQQLILVVVGTLIGVSTSPAQQVPQLVRDQLPGRQVKVSAICIGFGGDHDEKLKLAIEHLHVGGQKRRGHRLPAGGVLRHESRAGAGADDQRRGGVGQAVPHVRDLSHPGAGRGQGVQHGGPARPPRPRRRLLPQGLRLLGRESPLQHRGRQGLRDGLRPHLDPHLLRPELPRAVATVRRPGRGHRLLAQRLRRRLPSERLRDPLPLLHRPGRRGQHHGHHRQTRRAGRKAPARSSSSPRWTWTAPSPTTTSTRTRSRRCSKSTRAKSWSSESSATRTWPPGGSSRRPSPASTPATFSRSTKIETLREYQHRSRKQINEAREKSERI